MIEYADDMRILHSFYGLGIFAVIHKENGLAGSILQHRRRFHACGFQDICSFSVHGRRDGRFCRIAQHCQHAGICDRAAYGIRIRAAMSDDMDRALLDLHIGDALPIQLTQPFSVIRLIFTRLAFIRFLFILLAFIRLVFIRFSVRNHIGQQLPFINEAVQLFLGSLLAIVRCFTVAFHGFFQRLLNCPSVFIHISDADTGKL